MFHFFKLHKTITCISRISWLSICSRTKSIEDEQNLNVSQMIFVVGIWFSSRKAKFHENCGVFSRRGMKLAAAETPVLASQVFFRLKGASAREEDTSVGRRARICRWEANSFRFESPTERRRESTGRHFAELRDISSSRVSVIFHAALRD